MKVNIIFNNLKLAKKDKSNCKNFINKIMWENFGYELNYSKDLELKNKNIVVSLFFNKGKKVEFKKIIKENDFFKNYNIEIL